MERWINADQVRRHVPEGRKLPARFDDFLRAGLPFRVEWNDLDAYGLEPAATNEILPFLRLPDGGLVCALGIILRSRRLCVSVATAS